MTMGFKFWDKKMDSEAMDAIPKWEITEIYSSCFIMDGILRKKNRKHLLCVIGYQNMLTQNTPLWQRMVLRWRQLRNGRRRRCSLPSPFCLNTGHKLPLVKMSPHFSQTRERKTMFNTRDRDGTETRLYKQNLQNKPYLSLVYLIYLPNQNLQPLEAQVLFPFFKQFSTMYCSFLK